MQLDASDHLTFAGAITVGLAIIRLGERLLLRILERRNGNGHGKTTVVQLDPEVSRMVRETHESTDKIVDIVSVRDANGAPMVYAPRALLGRLDEKLDKILVRSNEK